MLQVDEAIEIAEMKYPRTRHTIIFIFDQSSCHCAYADDALVVTRMNVNPGGKQPKMHDTIWNGKI